MSNNSNPCQLLSGLAMSRSGALSQIARWILDHRDEVADKSLTEVARLAEVSETTVFRLARQIGYSGYREFRIALAELRSLERQRVSWFNTSHSEARHQDDPYSAIVNNTVAVHSEIVRSTADMIDPASLRAAVRGLQEARVVHVFGFGSSAGPVVDLYQRLVRFGFVVGNYSDPHVLTAVLSNPPAGSLFFGISFSGQSVDVIDALTSANRQNFPSVLITSHAESTAARLSNIVLQSMPIGASIGTETVGTRISQLAIIDMICTGLALEHPNKEQFLRNASIIEREIEKKRVAETQIQPRRSLSQEK